MRQAVSSLSSSYKKPSFNSLKSPKIHSNLTAISLPQNGDRESVKNLIQACFYLEAQEQLETPARRSLISIEKDMFLEDLRLDRLKRTVDMVRELEYSSEPEKLKQIYMYKVLTQEAYERDQREIKLEYRKRMMDPGRAVARAEQKRNKAGAAKMKAS
jgi:hypothetical protein